jgi:RNA 2',3'-cyclic 3'-phosphodiesterase
MDHRPDDILRLFYGVLLPADVQQQVAGLQRRLAAADARVKWVEPENLHLTLRFLGEQPALVLRDLKLLGHKLASECAPWEAQLQSLGAFPKLSRPQTLYVGMGAGLEPLTHLGARLNHKLEHEMIVSADDKPFHPHCTIGRVKQEKGLRGLVDLIQQDLGFATASFRCDHFQLLSSKLAASGPTYEILGEFGLGARG